MIIIYIVAIILNMITLGSLLYFGITSLFVIFRDKNIAESSPKTKFAVLIAARNEEKVLPHLLSSLNNQSYPDELYDVYVLPNNCTDNTKKVALDCAAKVIDIEEVDVKSKGEALKYAFDYFKTNNIKYDAYVIFDADNVVHPDFLKRANDAYCSGIKVGQGYRDSKNPCDSWISGAFSIYHWINDTFINNSRNNINQSSYINGTGFMVASSVIEKIGYNVITITEDTEFSILCALNGYKISFIKNAITYDEQATDFKTSIKQRKRWSYGTLQCLKKYGKKLIKKHSFQSLDMVMFLMGSILQLIAIISQIISNLPFSILYNGLESLIVGLAVSYLSSIFIALITVVINKKKVNILGVLLFPLFIFTWIPINIIVLFKKECKWEQIAHDRVLTIDEVA